MFIYRRTLLFILAGVLTVVAGCDSPPGPGDPTRPSAQLEDLTVVPDSISFEGISARYDTTVTVHIQSRITQLNTSDQPSYVIKSLDDSLVTQGPLEPADSANLYQATVDLDLTTTTFATYFTYVYSNSSTTDGSWIQSKINIFGLSGNPPEILAVSNPDTVYKPSGDSVRNVIFQAEVTDPDGQSNIETVAFELTLNNSVVDVIELFDDGSSQSGDPVAGDSVYSQVLSVDADNENATYSINYFAVDKAQLVSDTVETSFTITD